MPVSKDTRDAREALKNASFSEKLGFFKDYYLLPLIIFLFVAAIGGALLNTYFSKKEPALYVTMVNFNTLQEDTEGMTAPFAEEHINTRKEEIFIDSSSFISADENEINFLKYGYEDEQRLYTMVMTGSIDLFISGEDVLDRYIEQNWFDDLSGILDSADLAMYEEEDRILCRNGVPIGIRIDDSTVLKKYYYYNGNYGEVIYAAFPAGSLKRECAAEFVRYLLGK